jgi:hypothetical protein
LHEHKKARHMPGLSATSCPTGSSPTPQPGPSRQQQFLSSDCKPPHSRHSTHTGIPEAVAHPPNTTPAPAETHIR